MTPLFLDEAIRLSLQNVKSAAGGPFGAVVVQGDMIVGRGQNSVTRANDPTAHAEVVAIRDACRALQTFVLTGCVLYSSCEPCPMCLSAAYWARVDSVYYAATQTDAAEAGFDDAFLYRELALPQQERSLPALASPRHRAAAREAFEEWQASLQKITY